KAAAPTAEVAQEPSKPARPPRNEMGAFLAGELLKSATPGPEEERKRQILGDAARRLLSDLGRDSNSLKLARAAVQDVLDATALESESLVAGIWDLDEVELPLSHAIHVATYAVVFSLAFGRIDPALIADIGLAGLLHDVGLAQSGSGAARTPEN